jgi:hypothetical protein
VRHGIDKFSTGGVGPGLSAGGLVELACLFWSHLNLLAKCGVGLALEVDDALVVGLALVEDGRTLNLGYILDLGSRGSASETALGRPGADILVTKRAAAVSINMKLEMF